ncbi:MAG TPA: amidohydrolase [Novosphingobium sp.]|nr:amidohydrolase [Novosphingobium sp.]
MCALALPVCAQALPVVPAAAQTTAPPADRLFLHGQVLAPAGTAQALALRGGVIVAVGSDAEILALPHAGAEVVDLAGRTLMPGLYDMHVHVMDAGLAERACHLPQGGGAAAVKAAVQACARQVGPGGWILGGSWVAAALRPGEQTARLLDEAAPDHPVALSDEAHHSLWVNSRALAIAGITAATPAPAGGVIDRDAAGAPLGVLRETATALVESHIPAASPEEKLAAVEAATTEMLSYGIVGFTDAAVRPANAQALSAYARSGGLKQHARGCIVWGPMSNGAEALIARRQELSAGPMRFDCVKIFLDGVPTESHTGAMVEPYAHTSGAHGILQVPQARLNAAVAAFDAQGLEVKMHAAGDGATRAAADAIAWARAQNGALGPRHEIAHNTFITAADVPRGRQLGFIWEFSPYIWWPTPITSVDIARAVGPERMRRLWPIREALATGALVIAGSDWPVVPSVNPWLAIETMVSRQAPGATGPAQGAAEAVSRAQALAIFTRNGAAAMGRLDSGGTLEPGKQADMIVIDRNPLTAPLGSLHATRVLATYIAGAQVWAAR